LPDGGSGEGGEGGGGRGGGAIWATCPVLYKSDIWQMIIFTYGEFPRFFGILVDAL